MTSSLIMICRSFLLCYLCCVIVLLMRVLFKVNFLWMPPDSGGNGQVRAPNNYRTAQIPPSRSRSRLNAARVRPVPHVDIPVFVGYIFSLKRFWILHLKFRKLFSDSPAQSRTRLPAARASSTPPQLLLTFPIATVVTLATCSAFQRCTHCTLPRQNQSLIQRSLVVSLSYMCRCRI